MPSIAKSLKEKFCQGDNTHCARYVVLKALGKEKVPGNLFPNDENEAKKVISKG